MLYKMLPLRPWLISGEHRVKNSIKCFLQGAGVLTNREHLWYTVMYRRWYLRPSVFAQVCRCGDGSERRGGKLLLPVARQAVCGFMKMANIGTWVPQ